MPPPTIFISVADPSADANAALLAAELRTLIPNVRLRGVGGPRMSAAGIDLLADTVTRSAMGLAAIFRARELARLVRRIRRDLADDRPDLWICSDSWSVNYHFALTAKQLHVPVLYYVAPQTWASREGRIKKLRAVVDRLAVILPFEERYFRNHGINTTYVGHPLWDRLTTAPPHTRNAAPVVAILPGSRRAVTRANWPRLQQVMSDLRQYFPGNGGIRFKLPLTPNAAAVIDLATLPPDIEAKLDAFDELLPQCDLALCVSGTAALHVAAHHVPLIVVYHGNFLAWHLLGRWIIRARTFSLVNLLAGQRDEIAQGATIAPEFVPWYGPTKPVSTLATAWLNSPEELARRRVALARVVAPLATPGATRNVANMAVAMLGAISRPSRGG